MAPEQITCDPAADQRCDLYAMGGVAYTLLTGRPPFAGETATQVMNAHVHEPVVPPSQHRPEFPRTSKKSFSAAWRRTPTGDSRVPRSWRWTCPLAIRPPGGMPGRRPVGGRSLSREAQIPKPWDENPPAPS